MKQDSSTPCGCKPAAERLQVDRALLRGLPLKPDDPAPWLPREGLRALRGLLAELGEQGFKVEATQHAMWLAVGELQALQDGAERVLGGELQALAPQLEGIAPWRAGLASGRWGREHEQAALLRPEVGPLLCAAFLAGSAAAEGQPEAGREMALRALTALLWRAEPLARALHAARAWAAGQLPANTLEPVLQAAALQLRAAPEPKTLLELWRQGPRVLTLPEFPDLPPLVRKPPFSAWLLPENQAWAQCALRLTELFKPLPELPEKSPPSGVTRPTAQCGTAMPVDGWPLVIEGQGFGAQREWGVAVNAEAAQVTSWSDTRIELRTRALRPGCNRLSWSFLASWVADDDGVGAACSQALRLPRLNEVLQRGAEAWIAARTRLWTHPGPVSLLPPRIERFDSSAAGQALTPCTPVELSWALADLPCAGELGLIRLELLRDGQPLADHLPASGRHLDGTALDRDADYTLQLHSQDAQGQACSLQRADLRVRRSAKALGLSGGSSVDTRAPLRLRLDIPCPAPAGGLAVSLAVQPSDALLLPTGLLVPQGQTSLPFEVQAGAACGTASLSASAADHADARLALCVRREPGPVQFTPPMGLSACSAFTLRFDLPCADASLRAFAVDAAGQRHALALTGAPAGGGCQRAMTLSARSDGLLPGAYQLLLVNELGSSPVTPGFTVAAAPRVVQAPAELSVVTPCGATMQTLRVQVEAADAVRFSLPGSADTTVKRSGTPDCAAWSAAFAFDFTGNAIIDVTPSWQGQDGPTRSVPVRLAVGVGERSSYRLRGPAFMGASAQLTRIDTVSGGQPVESDAGSIGHGEERDFSLSNCVFTRFRYSYSQMGSPVSGETPDVRGHVDAPAMSAAHQI